MTPYRAGLAVLVLAHAWIVWRVLSAGLGVEDVAWIYWAGGFLLAAASAWRMHKSISFARGDALFVLGMFLLMQWIAAELLLRHGVVPALRLDAALALAGMAANFALDIRRQVAFDDRESPGTAHFLILWFARGLPFGLMVAVPWLLPDRFQYGASVLPLAFLAGVAAIDVLMHWIGPSFARELTTWQRKLKTKSSKNYLKWYRPGGNRKP
jgi:hypothetical protein